MNIPEPPQIIGAKRALTEEDVVRTNFAVQILNLAIADVRRDYGTDNPNRPIVAPDIVEAALNAVHRTLAGTDRTQTVPVEAELPLT